jgi:hypothetical protein
MTDEEQITQMRITILEDENDSSKDSIFNIMLSNAKAIALNTLYPFDKTITDIEKTNFRLRNWQVRCAIELYNAIGKNGLQSYTENGLSVTYFQNLISPVLYRELVPKAGAPTDNDRNS